MNIYFTADTHLTSPAILHTPRGKQFSSIEEHDDIILNNIKEVLQPNDRLYILGDIGSKKGIERFTNELDKFDVRVVFGNHCLSSKSVQYFRHNFTEAEHLLEYKYANGRIVMTHYPQVIWDQSFRNSISLFGHAHGNINAYLKQFRPNARMLDVGVDSSYQLLGSYRPFTLDEVFALTNKIGHSPDANRIKVLYSMPTMGETYLDCFFDYDFNIDYLPQVAESVFCNGVEYKVRNIDTDKLIITLFREEGYLIKNGDEIIWM